MSTRVSEVLKVQCGEGIVRAVRTKKEYMNLSEQFILTKVHEAIRLDPKLREAYYAQKDTTIKKIVKMVREHARKIYGVFQDSREMTQRIELLSKTDLRNTADMLRILRSHISTKERVETYPQFWEQLLALTKHPHSILDIGCGLNPVAYFGFTQCVQTTYLACELSQLDAEQLQAFFAHNNLVNASAIAFDAVRELDAYPTEHFDVVLLLKVLDTFERQKRYITYDILDKLSATYIVATFPRSTVKGRKTDRGDAIMWFEKMLARKSFSFSRVLFETEVGYICFRT